MNHKLKDSKLLVNEDLSILTLQQCRFIKNLKIKQLAIPIINPIKVFKIE